MTKEQRKVFGKIRHRFLTEVMTVGGVDYVTKLFAEHVRSLWDDRFALTADGSFSRHNRQRSVRIELPFWWIKKLAEEGSVTLTSGDGSTQFVEIID